MDRQALSDLAGSASFVVWLFAQSPQLYENYTRSSVDGLSLVFLAQWMAGDTTNLIGCLLTHQLPFQIAVATYFCSIDLCILAQYHYYWRKNRRQYVIHDGSSVLGGRGSSLTRSRYTKMGSKSLGSSTSSLYQYATLPASRRVEEHVVGSPTSRRPSSISSLSSSKADLRRGSSSRYLQRNVDWGQYEAMSRTAMNVAELASEAARRVAERGSSTSSTRGGSQARMSVKRANESQKKSLAQAGILPASSLRDHIGDIQSDEDEQSASSPTREMTDSMMSTSSSTYGYGLGSNSTQNLAAASGMTVRPSHSPIPEDEDEGASRRGRDMTRTAGKMVASNTGSPDIISQDHKASGSAGSAPQRVSVSPTKDRRGIFERLSQKTRNSTRSPAAKRSAGMVFLGVWAIFGLSLNQSSGENHKAMNTTDHGHVLAISKANTTSSLVTPYATAEAEHHVWPMRPSIPLYFVAKKSGHHRDGDDRSPSPAPGGGPSKLPLTPSWERIIGRISAWVCTLLYMTSRLPQIWENHLRRSVQGLSILLFISAALGNLLYSISVLVNPLASGEEASKYLRECLPFLLGSGGTLIFDAVIVSQWIVWRGLPPLYVEEEALEIEREGQVPPRVKPPSLRSRPGSSATRWPSTRGSLERQPLLRSSG